MPLDLRLDGEVIASIDEQVTGVSLQTARGTVSAAGLAPGDGVVDILVERVPPGGPIRLDQLEAQQLEQQRERQPEGTKIGFAPTETVTPVAATQGFHDETLRPGGVDKERSQRRVANPPLRDLSAGLDPDDTETRDRRIQAYNDHGDADRAIREVTPGGGGSGGGTQAPPRPAEAPRPGEPSPEEKETETKPSSGLKLDDKSRKR